MIKLGVATSVNNIEKVAAAGFDYLELNLAELAGYSDEEYTRVLNRVGKAPIGVECSNGMLPAGLKVAGPDVSAQAIHDYLDIAFPRAAELGIKVVVFGSGAARSIPEGFDTAQGWRQIGNFLRMAEKHAAECGMNLAIEPLRSVESSILNYVSEATLLASLLQLPHVGVLGDLYHMAMGGEGLKSLKMAGGLLKHVHVANAVGRRYPKPGDGEKYAELFALLKEMGYEGRVSIEAHTQDPDADLAPAFEALSQARG